MKIFKLFIVLTFFATQIYGANLNNSKIGSASLETKQAKTAKEKKRKQFRTFAFWSTRLLNLPTTKTIKKKDLLFRISHRFFPEVKSGYNTFFGLNGGAQVFYSLGYGISDKFNLTVGHGNLYNEWEFAMKWLLAEQWKTFNLPVSVAFNGGASLITQVLEGEKRVEAKRVKLNMQIVLARQLSDNISLMLVPSYSTNTNRKPFFWDQPEEGTFALGTGGRIGIKRNLSIVAEWLPVISGHKSEYNGWGSGVELKVGRHIFHLFITNSMGLIADQYLPGGDLEFSRKEFRFGFNLFRSF